MAVDPAVKAEPTFVPDAFRTSHNITGLLALARRLQTLIIMEPGTIPNLVDAGVGIGTYIHELADEVTLGNIRSRIQSQIDAYLPNKEITSLDAQLVNGGEDGKPYLAVFFKLGTPVDEKNTFALTFGSNSKGSAVKSEFYF